MKIRYSVDDLKRSISDFAGKPKMNLVLLRHTPNPSSNFIDLDVEIPFARGTFAKFESPLYCDVMIDHLGNRWTKTKTFCPEVHDHRVLARLKYSASWYPAAGCFSEARYYEGYETASTFLEAERSIANC